MNSKRIKANFNNREIILFLIIGGINTILNLIIMFFLYNGMKLGYWPSSFIAYMLSAISGFWLNRKYTFKCDKSILRSLIRFFIVIIICYFVAYSIARPLVYMGLDYIGIIKSEWLYDQIAMFIGQVIFTALNYIGQKFFAFK